MLRAQTTKKLSHSLHQTLLNFKTLTTQSEEKLIVKEGILRTASTTNAEQLVKVKECINQTYQNIQHLFSLSLQELNQLDFNVCLQLMKLLDEWAHDTKTKPISEEQHAILKLLKDGEQKLSSFQQDVKNESSVHTKKIIADSFEKLFEVKPPEDEAKQQRPNIILILSDEERALRGYEDPSVKNFCRTKLQGHQAIAENGITFTEHRTAATACTPSRAALYTGHYQSLHGVSQTNGLAKEAHDSKMHWLDPAVPTLGSYFEELGYESRYVGKWHLTSEDILDKDNYVKVLKPVDKKVDTNVLKEYEQKDALARFGFHGWVGPEPHGADASNAGFNRDPEFTRQACEWLKQHDQKPDAKPFLMTVNLVNPHDIVFIPVLWLYYAAKYKLPASNPDLSNLTRLPPSMDDSLSDKPSAQQAYKTRYSNMVCFNILNGSTGGKLKNWNWFNTYYQKMYWSYVKLADQCINEIYDTLKTTKFYQNTYVIKTSDHGDLTGAHGMVQKWYNAYEETVKLPLVISHPRLVNRGKFYNGLTSHIDLLPTLLKLAGYNADEIAEKLKAKHSETHFPVGKIIGNAEDFSSINTRECRVLESSYFLTLDNVMQGDTQYSIISKHYPILQNIKSIAVIPPIEGNTYIEMVTAKLEINHKIRTFKYVHYKTPDGRSDIAPEEEFYNLDSDSYEMKNLAKEHKLTSEDTIAFAAMKNLLKLEQTKKLTKPYQQGFTHQQQTVPAAKHHGPGLGFLAALAAPLAIPLALPLLGYAAYKFFKSCKTAGSAASAAASIKNSL